jgi:hypothetical protein
MRVNGITLLEAIDARDAETEREHCRAAALTPPNEGIGFLVAQTAHSPGASLHRHLVPDRGIAAHSPIRQGVQCPSAPLRIEEGEGIAASDRVHAVPDQLDDAGSEEEGWPSISSQESTLDGEVAGTDSRPDGKKQRTRE